jgi:hypothetical protein
MAPFRSAKDRKGNRSSLEKGKIHALDSVQPYFTARVMESRWIGPSPWANERVGVKAYNKDAKATTHKLNLRFFIDISPWEIPD